MAPRTRYARSGDLSIAYQVVGDGPVDIVHGFGFVSHLEYHWEEPTFARYLQRLASFSRLILFDKRGTGLSDRAAGIASMEERMDDVRAVMDAVGSERAVLFGVSESAPLMCLFAATYPKRTAALILCGAWASEVQAPDYPWGPTAEEYATALDEDALTIHDSWGTEGIGNGWGVDALLADMAPSVAGDPAFRTWFGALLRLGASPGAAMDLARMDGAIDVRHVLPTIRVPTLVLHRGGHENTLGRSRYVAAHIPGARLVELPGIDYLQYVGDVDAYVDEVEAFVTGTRPVGVPDHVLATVLAIEIAGAAGRAVALGDRRWADAQDRFHALGARELDHFRGRALDLTGDRVVATFDGPARAIRCAAAIGDAARDLGLATRSGLHTGECEVRGERVSGVAVPLAAWVASHAALDEILVTSTVKDLVAGAELRFADRGKRPLGGTPDEWQLFAVLPDGMKRAESAFPAKAVLPIPLPTMLTRREREVLPLVARGFSNRQIADTLSIGERTAESHVASILAKWGMSSRAQIAARTAGDDASPSR
ncbi:MAG TPA: alpha/beta fold hydrolase [Thermomicrobiales bacterium]|nr:alpha/beta fold hydrolase [Thermomicrobiales bacterium]